MATGIKSAPLPPPPPQWVLELNSTPAAPKQKSNIADPPGFASRTGKRGNSSKQSTDLAKKPTVDDTDSLKLKKAWEVAIAPAKQLPMNAIGMYMSGNSLQIFSIMMVFMLFKGPIQAIFSINQTFQRFETPNNKDQMILVKISFVACNCLLLALGIWKVNGMGLLPTTRSDWLAWEPARIALERGVREGDDW